MRLQEHKTNDKNYFKAEGTFDEKPEITLSFDDEKKFDERDDCDKYDNSTVKLGGDIYSMAFALFLDP